MTESGDKQIALNGHPGSSERFVDILRWAPQLPHKCVSCQHKKPDFHMEKDCVVLEPETFSQ